MDLSGRATQGISDIQNDKEGRPIKLQTQADPDAAPVPAPDKGSHRAQADLTDPLTISVVVPVFNEELVLSSCLDALSRQTHPPMEILVVDNNSTDRSAEIARSFPLVRVIREERQGIAWARTRGFDEARGSLLVRVDADTIASPDLLRAYRDAFSDPDLAGARGREGIAELSPGDSILGWQLFSLTRMVQRVYVGAGPIMYGCNCALRKSTWETIRPFLTLNDQVISEDIDVSLAILSSGLKIAVVPGARTKTRTRSLFRLDKMRAYAHRDQLTFDKYQLDRRTHRLVRPEPIQILDRNERDITP